MNTEGSEGRRYISLVVLVVSISLINDINILMCVHFINLGTYDSSFTSKL
jgi:hypothetical protein